jgi:thiol-disulfide isomerase/thioredoxin
MKFQFALLILLLFPISHLSNQVAAQTVPLQKEMLPSTGKLTGISNIFFRKLDKDQIQYPPGWQQVEISPLLENPEYLPVFVIRYKATTGEMTYVVDTNGDRDFRQEPTLQFRQFDAIRIADFELTIRPAGSTDAVPYKMSYQVLLSNDGYSYARISEYRQGQIRLGDKSFGIILRPRTRNKPAFNLPGDTICMIDLNRDGDYSERWHIADGGDLSPREEMALSAPFILAGKKLKIVELDPAGTSLKIQPSSEDVSISPGFKAPEFAFKGIDSNSYSLASLKGKIVLLEFWSVSCPFCRQILPEVNALVKKESGKDFVALDVTREEDAGEITKHLQSEPRSATVVINDKATWQTYNRESITPTYYLIDKDGVIRMSGYGASPEQLKAIERLVEQIRNGK